MTIQQEATLTWQTIKTHLETKKAQLYTQIGNYPTPITGCDQQFNHLLDQQRQVSQELMRVREAERKSDSTQAVQQFIQTSIFLYSDIN